MEFNAAPPQFKVQRPSASSTQLRRSSKFKVGAALPRFKFQVSAFSFQPSTFDLAVRRKTQAGPLMVRAYHNVRATGGAVFFPLRGENTRERWSPFKVEGDGGCSKKDV